MKQKEFERRMANIISSPLNSLPRIYDSDEDEDVTDTAGEKLYNMYNQQQAVFEARTDERLKALSDIVLRMEKTQEKTTENVNRLTAKLEDGWGERLVQAEADIEKRISREEFNEAMRSLRNSIGTLKWIFGLCFSALVALMYLLE